MASQFSRKALARRTLGSSIPQRIAPHKGESRRIRFRALTISPQGMQKILLFEDNELDRAMAWPRPEGFSHTPPLRNKSLPRE
jgi:hypothetical protein